MVNKFAKIDRITIDRIISGTVCKFYPFWKKVDELKETNILAFNYKISFSLRDRKIKHLDIYLCHLKGKKFGTQYPED